VTSLKRAAERMDRTVGAWIRTKRRTARLTQSEIAGRLGLSYQQVQKYEHGVNRISAGRLWAFAQVLGAGVEDFFRDKPEPLRPGGGRRPARLPLPPRVLDPNVEAALVRLVRALARQAK